MGFKLHSQTPQTPPIPSTKTIQVTPNKKYPHQTVSLNPSRSRLARRPVSSSKNEELLILDAGDLLSRDLSSEEDELGPVVEGSGGNVE